MLEPRLILVHLLLKLGVAAALSSALVRSKEFKSLIFREHRATRHKIYLALVDGDPHRDRRLDTIQRHQLSLWRPVARNSGASGRDWRARCPEELAER